MTPPASLLRGRRCPPISGVEYAVVYHNEGVGEITELASSHPPFVLPQACHCILISQIPSFQSAKN